MATMTDDPFIHTTPADFGMEDVVWCHRRGLLSVAWSRKREPSCDHGGIEERSEQPASMCRICKDGPELLAWRRYWNQVKAEAARIRAEHENAT